MEERQRRSFTDDYKRQAVDLVASSGRSIGSVAKELARISHTDFARSGRIAEWQVGIFGDVPTHASGGRGRSLGLCWAAVSSEGLVSVGLG